MVGAVESVEAGGGGALASTPGRLVRTLVGLTLAAVLLGACGGSKYPSFLPKHTLNQRDDTVLTGTVDRPALTSQGDPVEVVTPHWRVRAVVTGPNVPGEGLPVQQPATYCTWTITLSDATGDVPVLLSDFRPIDFVGETYQLSLPPGQTPLPSVLRPKQTLTFQVRDFETVGEGVMRWAPDGDHIVAKWDLVVEND
jgi:hypothetical protein